MTINLAYLEVRLSGGAANADPDASLGGVMSSQRVLSQSATGLSNITGVVIDDAAGNAEGAGTLDFNFAATTLVWTPSGGAAGAAVDVSVDGRYTLFDSTEGAYLLVTVTAASLPGANQSDSITIANLANKTFDDISKTESFNGEVDFRCFYYYNADPTDTFLGSKLFIPSQPSGADDLQVGLGTAGVGDGSTTGVEQTIADELTAPVGVSFSAPATAGAGIAVPDVAPGEVHAFWQRRNVPAGTAVSTPNDISSIGLQTNF